MIIYLKFGNGMISKMTHVSLLPQRNLKINSALSLEFLMWITIIKHLKEHIKLVKFTFFLCIYIHISSSLPRNVGINMILYYDHQGKN